jgi:hypothetical protein
VTVLYALTHNPFLTARGVLQSGLQVLSELVEAAQALPEDETLHNSVLQMAMSFLPGPDAASETMASGTSRHTGSITLDSL